MYKLYNVKAWGSLCVHFLLEEMEIPYTNIWMTPEQVKAPEFRDLSPLGLIPALGLQDGRILFESAAIVSFLVTAHPEKGLSPRPGSDDYGEFLSWLHFMGTHLYPAIPSINASSRHDPGVAAGCDRLWTILAQRLEAEGSWLMRETYSALDPYAFMISLWGVPTEEALHKKFPAIAKLARAIRARPKLKAALEAHGVLEIGGWRG